MCLFSFSKSSANHVNWEQMISEEQLLELLEKSSETAVLFFKHSTRCSISSMAKSRLEKNSDLDEDQVVPVYLDLIKYRSLSNKLAEILNVTHQSPQVLLVKNKKCIYNASHNQILVDDIKKQL